MEVVLIIVVVAVVVIIAHLSNRITHNMKKACLILVINIKCVHFFEFII
jgi:hypothetical protein